MESSSLESPIAATSASRTMHEEVEREEETANESELVFLILMIVFRWNQCTATESS